MVRQAILDYGPALIRLAGGGAALDASVAAAKSLDPDDIRKAGSAVKDWANQTYHTVSRWDAERRRMFDSAIAKRLGRTSVPVTTSGGSYGRSMAGLRRVSLRFGRSRRRRAYRVGRRRFGRSRVTRRPALVSRFAYGTNPQGRVGIRGRVRRVLPRYVGTRSSAQVKYYDFIVRQHTYAAASESALGSATYDFPSASTGQYAVLYPFFGIAVNNTTSGRITDSIRMLRLDLFVELNTGNLLDCSDTRISVVQDRDPSTAGTLPLLSEIFDAASGFFSGYNEIIDCNLYPKVDERNRFGILWQQNTPVSRGALSSDGTIREFTDQSCKRFVKTVWMRNHRMTFRQNSTTGALSQVSSGAVYICLQGGLLTSSSQVGWNIRGRLVYTDM